MYDKDDGTAGLDRFSDIDYDKFKKAMGEYLQPLIKLLVAPFPVGQIVSLLDQEKQRWSTPAAAKVPRTIVPLMPFVKESGALKRSPQGQQGQSGLGQRSGRKRDRKPQRQSADDSFG